MSETYQNKPFAGNTNMGMIRTNNEDAFLAQYIWDENNILAVVIDGVGGYEGGEVASAIAQKTIVEYLENYANGERIDLLKQAVISANNSIYEERQKNPDISNMSCVLTAVIVELEQRRINMAHVGDTRLYQYHNDELVKLSHDHSPVGYREEIGELTEEEAMHHSQRNVISRDVGSQQIVGTDSELIEAQTFHLEPQSTLLMCSDGLCDMITSAQMKDILRKDASLEEKVNMLIDEANKAGGKDNVTVVLVDSCYTEEPPMMEIPEKEEPKESKPTEDTPKDTEEEKNNITTTDEKKKDNKKTSRLKIFIGYIAVAVIFFAAGFFVGYSIEQPAKVTPQPTAVTDTCTTNAIGINKTDSLMRKDSVTKHTDSIHGRTINTTETTTNNQQQ